MMEGIGARLADKLVAVGWEQRRQIQSSYRLAEHRIGVVWNGIALRPVPTDQSFRAQLGTGDRLLVGTIAKLIEQKGLDDLLGVARRCKDADLRIQFVIIGGGPLRQQLEQRQRELDLSDTVVFAGWVPDAASKALPAFDVFFQPSRWEAMSIAVLEAMAAAKAIVATKVGDNPRVLQDGLSGLLVSPSDIDDMVRALTSLTNRKLRQDLGRAARQHFEQRFTLDHMVRGYEEAYHGLVARCV
jgi:glycosyltransferase involved in cell wall biosynthesis